MRRNFFTGKILFTITMVFVVCCLVSTSSWAANKVHITSANAKGFIGQLNQNGAAMGPVFGLSQHEGFQLLRQSTDFNGVTHSRYQQIYKGIPYWGIQTIVSKGHNNKVVRLNGNIVQGAHREIGAIPAKLDAAGALNRMKTLHADQNIGAEWYFRNETSGTYIYLYNGKARLCHVVSFFADAECGNPSQPVIFIDARSGRVLDSFDGLNYGEGTGPGGNLKVGKYYYGPGGDYPGFGVTVDGSTCIMDVADVRTVDLNHRGNGDTTFSYACYENTHEEINDGYCPMNDAQYFGQVIYDTYMDWYGVPILPFQLTLKCHYKKRYDNALWDGTSMYFGDGYTTFYPLVALDVVAHEVSHGFTDFNSDLVYREESGGINESFSDMAGEAAKYYMRGTNDFMCGYDIFKDPDKALRYLCNPTQDGRSIDHVDDYYDGLDVHYSSGVFNKAFCLIANSEGWTTRMAFDIFVKANQDYWTTTTNFQQGAEGAQAAAADYGYSCTAVRDAFAQVGITLTCD
ncbi:M4 family metallopeptidase [Acidobacteriota bacterium]